MLPHSNNTRFLTFFFILISVSVIFYRCGGGGGGGGGTSDAKSVLPAPGNFKAISGYKKIILGWDKVNGAKSYTLYRSDAKGKSTDGIKIPDIKGTDYTDDGLAGSMTYYYNLTAIAADGTTSGFAGEKNEKTACKYAGDLTGDGGYKLPDTGQTQNFTDTCGEDSDYKINTQSYDTSGDTVTDNNTGLIWQKLPKGGHVKKSWEDANKYCIDLNLADHDDWRLPTIGELTGILDLSKSRPTININFFPNTQKEGSYWSSTAYNTFTEYKWSVSFEYGSTENEPKSKSFYVRCVRSPTPPPVTRFTDHSDDTVSDLKTGLMWQKLPEKGKGDHVKKSWEDAIKHCEILKFAGYTDWRLPNAFELKSLINYEKKEPAIYSNFPNTAGDNQSEGKYWSSSRYALSSGSGWIVNFKKGNMSPYYSGEKGYARCVRSR